MDNASFIRYLSVKRTVDDRALNRRVWDAMLSCSPAAARVLEIGGGIGTMIERIIDDGRLRPGSWTMIDAQPVLIEEARRRLVTRAPFALHFSSQALEPFLGSRPGPFDLVVANAFLDLVDAPRTLPRLLFLVAPGGHFYFSINFDGLTILEPEIDRDLDRMIVETYHRTMDERRVDGAVSGDSRCGRHLLTLLPASGFRILETGSSDWIVLPRDGRYAADEAYFLECILSFFEESLSPRAEIGSKELGQWLAVRRAQVARGELVFIAHQVDVLAAAQA